MADLPVWLRKSYISAVQEAGCQLPQEQLSVVYDRLIARWSAPERAFHGLHHLITCLSKLESFMPEVRHPELVTLAMWYHGVEFSTEPEAALSGRGGEDEGASAGFARRELIGLGVPENRATAVSSLILGMRYAMGSTMKPGAFTVGAAPGSDPATHHHRDAAGGDLLGVIALRDAHLAVLASTPQAYKKYTAEIRQEYAAIPPSVFVRARLRIVERFLARKHLFAGPGTKPWEDRARQNLEAEAQRLRRSISRMDAEAATRVPSADDVAASAPGPDTATAPSTTVVPLARVLPTPVAHPGVHATISTPSGTRVPKRVSAFATLRQSAPALPDPMNPLERVMARAAETTTGITPVGVNTAGDTGNRTGIIAAGGDNVAQTGTERTTLETPADTTAGRSTLETSVDQLSNERAPVRATTSAPGSSVPDTAQRSAARQHRKEVATRALEAIERRSKAAREAREQRDAAECNANSPLADKQRTQEFRAVTSELMREIEEVRRSQDPTTPAGEQTEGR